MQILALFVGRFLCLVVFFCVDFNYISKIIYPVETTSAIYLSYHISLKISMELHSLVDKTALTLKKKIYQC